MFIVQKPIRKRKKIKLEKPEEKLNVEEKKRQVNITRVKHSRQNGFADVHRRVNLRSIKSFSTMSGFY